MVEYINRVDAINALCSDDADESMTKYLDGVYGRLMAIRTEPVIAISDIVAAEVEILMEHPDSDTADVLTKFLVRLLDNRARKDAVRDD